MKLGILVVAVTVTAGGAVAQDTATVRLQSRSVALSPASTRAFLGLLRDSPSASLHGLAYLRRLPTSSERRMLARGGVTLLEWIEGRVFYASVSGSPDSSLRPLRELVGALAPLTPADRVAPDLWERRYDGYRAPDTAGDTVNYLLNADGTLRVAIRFHRDVTAVAAGEALRRYGARAPILTGPAVSAVVTREALEALAGADEVSWIDADGGPVRPDNDVTRQAIGVDGVQQFDVATGQALGLSGAGVQVAVYDVGFDEGHPDFQGRVAASLPARKLHGTLVAGIIAGSGSASDQQDSWGQPNGGTPYQWRGMAPGAELLERSSGDFNSTSLLLQGLSQYIAAGGDVSNHSHNIVEEGRYGDLSRTVDDAIRGDGMVGGVPVPARLQVYSAGNRGDGLRYFKLNKEVKNGIIVGNWDATKNRPYAERQQDGRIFATALGPTVDGRIKPDVVAPGSWVHSTGYWDPASPEDYMCTSLPAGTDGGSTVRRNFYATDCGTSLAAPAVTGVVALLLQQYQETYGVDLDEDPPLPSTLRGVVIHTAKDLQGDWTTGTDGLPLSFGGQPAVGFAGPDYATGFGLVDAGAAVDVVGRGLIREDELSSVCEVKTYFFRADAAAGPVKVTLAWDDPATPASSGSVTQLVNDLDLVLVDPNGTRHYPWVLGHRVTDNGGNPLPPESQACGSDPVVEQTLTDGGTIDNTTVVAATTGRDRLNNVEQVVAPYVSGLWHAEVTGFRVTEAQAFSLVGIPPLTVIPVPPPTVTICQLIPALCRPFGEAVCARFPEICARPRVWFRWDGTWDGRLHLLFIHEQDLMIVPLADVCELARESGACGPPSDAASWNVRLGPTYPGGISVEVLDSNGRRVAGATVSQRAETLRWSKARGVDYYLMLRPARGAALHTPLALPVSFGR